MTRYPEELWEEVEVQISSAERIPSILPPKRATRRNTITFPCFRRLGKHLLSFVTRNLSADAI